MGEISDDLPIRPLSKFDVDLQDFFRDVLGDKTQKVTDTRKRFIEALKIICTDEGPQGAKSCYEYSLHRKIYLFKYSPCYTFAVANHFQGMVSENPLILKDALCRKHLNICCLGGGPGTEVVAISKVLSLAQDNFEKTSEKPLRLRVTIVDENASWKKTACQVLQTLANSGENFVQTKVGVRLRFLVADLKQPLSEDVRKAIHEADIVTMVTFLSALGEKFSMTVSRLTKDIVACMKPNTVLFYLDTGQTEQCHAVQKCLAKIEDIVCVYGPIELEAFTLSLPSLRRNIELFWKTFYGSICLTDSIINSCAWIKAEYPKKHKKSLENPHAELLHFCQWIEKSFQTKEKLEAFHDEVEKILPNRKLSEKYSSAPHINQSPVVKDLVFANKSKNRPGLANPKSFAGYFDDE